jgi:DNA-binding CsgD family transcriptional regulator
VKDNRFSQKGSDIPGDRMETIALPAPADSPLKDISSRFGPDPETEIRFLLTLACRLLEAPGAVYQSGEGSARKTYAQADRMPPDETAFMATAAAAIGSGARRQPRIIEDLTRFGLGPAAAANERQGLGACLVQPVVVPGQAAGALAVFYTDARQFGEKELGIMDTLAAALSMVENRRRSPSGFLDKGSGQTPPDGRAGSTNGPETGADSAAGGSLARRTGVEARTAGARQPVGRRKPQSIRPGARSMAAASRLTPAEVNVADLIGQGKTSKQIAGALEISIRTVEAHRYNIRQKLGLNRETANLKNHLQALGAATTKK